MTSEPTIEASAPPPAQTGGPLTELIVMGMTCGNCAQHVTEAIQNVGGVRTATVNLDSGKASVIWASGAEPDPIRVIQAVEAAGYRAKVAAPGIGDSAERRLAGWRLNLWLGVLGTLPLMLGEWVLDLRANDWFRWLSLALASVVQIVAGAPFFRGAWNQLRIRSANMDTLVVLGSSTAFAYSIWAFFTGAAGHLYFLEAAAIITIVSLGHWFEARASARASRALQGLLHLAPDRARRLDPDGREVEVPVAELRPGHRIALLPGDRVPTDAQVLEGNSAVDESMLTGESIPVDKTAGTLLYTGTLNLNGRLLARVTSTGEETALARIIVAVQRAQTSRANIQRLGDHVSSVFVPVVIVVAVAAALFWGLAPETARHVHQQLAQFLWHAHVPTGALAAPFIIAAAVLIIACPCAMGLATPVAIMAGTNAAAQRGILIRDGIALEKAGNLTAVLFDKTGTLTLGKPHVVEIWEAGETRNVKSGMPSAAVNLAAALARNSKHPFSQAVAALSSNEVDISDWKEIPGSGVQGRAVSQETFSPREATRGTRIFGPRSPISKQPLLRLGSLRWLEQSGVPLQQGEPFIKQWAEKGATLLGFANESSLQALFAVQDPIKLGAREVVAHLQRQGIKTYLITGDNPLTAVSIARQAGIAPEHVFAQVPPEEKAELVKKLQREGARIAFVGDGINDAPALEQADLGVAVSRASDIAREAADIILLKSGIEMVPESLDLARATLRTIKQNLFWAFFYNAIGVPLAALGFMSPVLCAAAMGLSDLVVIGNALRLRRLSRFTPGAPPPSKT